MLKSLRHAHTTPQPPKRVVVLGARGFVGTALVRELVRLDIPTLALSSTDVDLANPKAGMGLADRLRADDAIVFLSALKSGRALDQAAMDANLAMARAVCEGVAASSCQHIVYLS